MQKVWVLGCLSSAFARPLHFDSVTPEHRAPHAGEAPSEAIAPQLWTRSGPFHCS